MPAPVTHILYGGGAAEFTADIPSTSGQPILSAGNVTLTVWDEGTQLTDLYDASGNGPVSSVASDPQGGFAFWALDGLGTLHVSTDDGVTLYPVQPANIGNSLEGLRADFAGITETTGIPLSQKGQPSGVATLDTNGLLVQQVPSTARVVGLDLALTNRVLTTDARLTDARTPTVHASSHATAGADPLLLDLDQINGLIAELASKATLSERYWDPVARVWTPRPTLPANVPAKAYSTSDPTADAPPGAVQDLDVWIHHPDQVIP